VTRTAPEAFEAWRVPSFIERLAARRATHGFGITDREVGWVRHVAGGVARLGGLPGVAYGERVTVVSEDGRVVADGVATDLDVDGVGIVLLSGGQAVTEGLRAERTGRPVSVPVGEGLLGRVVDPLGRPRDEGPAIRPGAWRPVERPAPEVLARAPVRTPLATGVTALDALLPIGRGQRELILGDRQTGKTTLALTAVLAQRGTGVQCVWCSVGQGGSGTAKVVAALRRSGALAFTTVVASGSDDLPGYRWLAPFAAMSMAEAMADEGTDVLLVIDDVTEHARAYREMSLLLRRPPGREAYPGDVFHLHARLLERAAQLRSGGSITALPILQTQERELAAYIPTNLISICDGQVVLSNDLAARGVLPAIDVGRSVSRVGGKAQDEGYREVAGQLRLDLAQFEELERFARFGADLDVSTRDALVRGTRVRAVLRQGPLEVIPASEQRALLHAASEGWLDEVPEASLARVIERVREAVASEASLRTALASGVQLSETDHEDVRRRVASIVREVRMEDGRRTV